jgi:methionyl-tRNA synthetase
MNWIDKLLPVVTLIIGWGISEFGKFSTERKNNAKKFKKLLFNLLELRWLLKREMDLNNDITQNIERLKQKISAEFGEDVFGDTEVNLIKPMITEILKSKIVQPNKIKEIETNIDSTINELAEIYPVFAYELSGRYKIKERLEGAEDYFNEVSEFIEEMPKELTEWIQPRLSDELFEELDGYILEIAKKINRKTKRDIVEKFSIKNSNDTDEMDKFIDEYIERLKTIENRV